MDHNVRRSRGEISELIVEQALETIRRAKYDIPPIEEIIHSYPNSGLDRRGIDFLVRFEDGKTIPLQVKSSTRGRRKFESHCRLKGISIPVVIAAPGEQLALIINRVIKAIKLVFSIAKRAIDAQVHVTRKLPKRSTKDWCHRYFVPSMCH